MSLSIEILKEIAKIGWFSANRGTHNQFDGVLSVIDELDEKGFLGRVQRIKNHQIGNREIDLAKATGLTVKLGSESTFYTAQQLFYLKNQSERAL